MMQGDLCACGAAATVGCVGVENGQVYSRSFCDACYYNNKMKQPASPSTKYKVFTDLGIRVSELNSGKQLCLKKSDTVVDYWPSTGKFIVRGTRVNGEGISALLGVFE